MAIPRALRKKQLDGKELFYLYHVELGAAGSLNKLQQLYPINPATGKPFSTGAFHQSMWRWALQNWDEAEEIYSRYLLDFGVSLSDLECKQMIRKRVKILNKTQRKKFFQDHPEYA